MEYLLIKEKLDNLVFSIDVHNHTLHAKKSAVQLTARPRCRDAYANKTRGVPPRRSLKYSESSTLGNCIQDGYNAVNNAVSKRRRFRVFQTTTWRDSSSFVGVGVPTSWACSKLHSRFFGMKGVVVDINRENQIV
jgi:hypothetical protein